jgi:DnaK suppressor protein
MNSTPDQIIIRRKLEAERTELLERIAEVTRRLDEQEDHLVELADRAVFAATRQLQTIVLSQSQHQLQLVEAALQRLAEGRYGTCTECGQAIRPMRLMVLPYAATCVKCQKKQEQSHGRYRSLA